MSARAADLARTAARGLGQALITVGVVLLLFCAYELWVTNIVTDRAQSQLHDELEHQWALPAPSAGPATPSTPSGTVVPAVELGSAFAIIRIPKLGDGPGHPYARVVVEGTSHEDLKKGPGHFVGTQLPGELGNLVISGHRTTYGAPFSNVDELKPGDAVVIETRDTWYTYSVTGTKIVSPSDVAVTYPVPDHPGQAPTQSVITLTSCNPKYSAAQRIVVSGVLTGTQSKAQGAPAALTGG